MKILSTKSRRWKCCGGNAPSDKTDKTIEDGCELLFRVSVADRQGGWGGVGVEILSGEKLGEQSTLGRARFATSEGGGWGRRKGDLCR
jgi:hypothetical protein